MYIEAKSHAKYMVVFCLISTIIMMVFIFGIMIPLAPFVLEDKVFRLFIVAAPTLLIGQLLVFVFLAIKGSMNKHLVLDGEECETELLEIGRPIMRQAFGFYSFYVRCKYKTPSGEFKNVKSSTRFVLASVNIGYVVPKGFECVPKVYVDKQQESKYYVSVLVRK